jgi:hypothetical protein
MFYALAESSHLPAIPKRVPLGLRLNFRNLSERALMDNDNHSDSFPDSRSVLKVTSRKVSLPSSTGDTSSLCEDSRRRTKLKNAILQHAKFMMAH